MSPKCDIRHADSIAALKELPECSVHSVVTDPPYGLSQQDRGDVVECLRAWLSDKPYEHGKAGFMGKSWDGWVPGPELWKEVYRVLKPGGHLAVFAGSRTSDLMGIALRLSGFECRDTISWVQAQGFPKSLDVSKAIDKAAGIRRQVIGVDPVRAAKLVNQQADYVTDAGWSAGNRSAEITAPATDDAKRFDGYGTALKPAREPILLFRKPLEGTVVENVLKHSTGALNIGACKLRVVGKPKAEFPIGDYGPRGLYGADGDRTADKDPAGRWPANFVLSHADDCASVGSHVEKGDVRGNCGGRRPSGFVGTGSSNGDAEPNSRVYGNEVVEDWQCAPGCPVAELDAQSGVRPGCTSPSDASPSSKFRPNQGRYMPQGPIYGDTGTAARFFYCSKSSKKDRHTCSDGAVRRSIRNVHPTVKPLDLMRWLIRLVTPKGGTALDPFVGSGTTAVAAVLEGFDVIGFDRDEAHARIARQRCGLDPVPEAAVDPEPETKPEDEPGSRPDTAAAPSVVPVPKQASLLDVFSALAQPPSKELP